jgi:hypothetical protein
MLSSEKLDVRFERLNTSTDEPPTRSATLLEA